MLSASFATPLGFARVLLCAALLTGACGCRSVPANLNARGLATALEVLAPEVNHEEASQLADTAYKTSRELAKEYRIVKPPFLHNCLVNAGLRKKGLCYHWADDLGARLNSLQCQTLEVHPAVAHLATLREHNSIIVTARGASFTNGIVLDPWRGSGTLYWGPAAKDKYPWRPAHPAKNAASP